MLDFDIFQIKCTIVNVFLKKDNDSISISLTEKNSQSTKYFISEN